MMGPLPQAVNYLPVRCWCFARGSANRSASCPIVGTGSIVRAFALIDYVEMSSTNPSSDEGAHLAYARDGVEQFSGTSFSHLWVVHIGFSFRYRPAMTFRGGSIE
jgi:hypothetical protein